MNVCLIRSILIPVPLLLIGSCGRINADKKISAEPTETSPSGYTPPTSKIPLSEIDLATIGHIAPKGRVQDREYNELLVVDQLLAHGKESIPFLISKLDDKTKIYDSKPQQQPILDFWYQTYVGDVALVILTDFFLDKNWEKSTIQGMDWDGFLDRGTDRNITGEELLRRYIRIHGRRGIKQRWEQVWERYEKQIFWDEADSCFKINP
jgi:hypothetical protein